MWSAVISGKSIERMLELLRIGYPGVWKVTETIVLVSRKDSSHFNFLLRNPAPDSIFILELPEESIGHRLIEIDPRGFYPLARHRLTKKLILSECDNDKQFFEDYAGHSVFSVHRDGRNDGHSHHAFHVDFEKMVPTSRFTSKVDGFIKEFGSVKFDAVITAEKSNNACFLEHLKPKIQCNEVRIVPLKDLRSQSQPELRSYLSQLGNSLGRTPNVLFLEAVAIRGRDIACFTQAWRTEKCSLNVFHLIGLLRSRSSYNATEMQKMLKTAYGDDSSSLVRVLEQVVLPTWGAEACPWCKELKLLQRVEGVTNKDEDLQKHIIQRRFSLENKNGSRQQLLHGAAEKPDTNTFDRSEASKFFNTSAVGKKEYFDADWMLSVASIFQRWRTGESSTTDLAIHPSVVVAENMFNDPFLRAAIFRCVTSEEISHQSGDDRKAFLDFITSGMSFKDPNHRYFYLGREAVLSFGELFQNMDLELLFDEVGVALCKAKLGRI
jgi:hypothetical protein